jgi:hypothetical protein
VTIDLNLVVGIITIVGAILGVGWKLGRIATSIQLEIAELKGILGTIQQGQNNTDSRVTRLEGEYRELEIRLRNLEQKKN